MRSRFATSSMRAACSCTWRATASPRATRWPSGSGCAVRKTPASSSIRRRVTRMRPAPGAQTSCSTIRRKTISQRSATVFIPCSLLTESAASPCAITPSHDCSATRSSAHSWWALWSIRVSPSASRGASRACRRPSARPARSTRPSPSSARTSSRAWQPASTPCAT